MSPPQNEVEWDERKDVSKRIEEKEAMIASAGQQPMRDEIDVEDFRIIKCRAEVRILEDKPTELPTKTESMKTLGMEWLRNLWMDNSGTKRPNRKRSEK